MQLNSMIILKIDSYSGECSVKLADEDEDGLTLFLNKIIIDLTDGSDPVKIYKFNQTPLIAGTFVDGIKTLILNVWQENFVGDSYSPGAWQVDGDGITKL